jgi:hypothetical protein
MENRSFRLAAAALTLLAMPACGGKSKSAQGAGAGGMGASGLEVPKVDAKLCSTKGKTVQTFDLNHDNKPDVWKLFAEIERGGTKVSVLTCKQVDYDHDGGMDYVATYQETGELIAEEFDFTFDGKFDAREHYDKRTGNIYLVERDTDHDKRPDLWEKYDSGGKLESIRRDRNADGKPDVWEQYANDALVAILYDDDYDTRVDRKEEAQRSKPPEPAPELERDESPDGAPTDEDKSAPPPAGAGG